MLFVAYVSAFEGYETKMDQLILFLKCNSKSVILYHKIEIWQHFRIQDIDIVAEY